VHRTPRWLVDPRAPLSLDALEERFRDALLGQPDAVHAALSTIALIKAGLSDQRRPFGVFLFMGPTGVGKTHLAQLLAAELFGSAERMVRLNMGDFAGPRGAEALFGDPEHHLPANRRGVLTQRLMGRPFCVLLLDEFEKSHVLVHERLLPLIDEGCFVNGAGESVSCRSSIIIATSNAGAEVYRESALGFTTPVGLDSKREELERRVQQTFRFELLNRFDRVVYFQPLSREDIRELAVRELRALEQRPGMRRAGTRLRIDEAVLDWLAARGYDARYGARFLRRAIEREVTSAVAEAMTRSAPDADAVIALEVRRGRIRARRDAAPGHAAAPARAPAPAQTANAAAIMEGARPRLDALARDVAERDRLLTEMAEPEFWDDATRRGEVIERFRTLDVMTRLVQRFAQPLARLDEMLGAGDSASPALLGEAAAALRAWEERERLEGERSVWLLLSGVHGDGPSLPWLLRLARMFMAWCRLNELRCAPVAFEPRAGDACSRLVLEVEGPGAEHFLDAERGVHRQRRSGAPDAHARVDVVPQGSDGFGVDVRDRALLRGPFAIMARVEATLSLAHTGQSLTLAGASRAALAGMVGDLQAAWSGLRLDSPALVRSYGEAGGVVLDPRTGASAPLRRVERGRLEVFRDAWRQAHGEARDTP
jgi:MoxR-like ATPase